MIERAAPYGGQVEAGPNADHGWHVRVRLHFDDGVIGFNDGAIA
jgi:hypothetical protein